MLKIKQKRRLHAFILFRYAEVAFWRLLCCVGLYLIFDGALKLVKVIML